MRSAAQAASPLGEGVRLVAGDRLRIESRPAVADLDHHAVGVAHHRHQRPRAVGMVDGVAHRLAGSQDGVEDLVL